MSDNQQQRFFLDAEQTAAYDELYRQEPMLVIINKNKCNSYCYSYTVTGQCKRIWDFALASHDEQSDNGEAFRPEKRNPVAKGAERGSEGHGVAEGRQGKYKSTEYCDICKLCL